MSSSGIVWNPDTLTPGIQQFPNKLLQAVNTYMEFNTAKVQDYARSNAPWTDRTGNARQGLFAQSYQGERGVYGIVVYHTMPYGIWLEVANEGRFRIIIPTVEHEGGRIMQGITKLVERLS